MSEFREGRKVRQIYYGGEEPGWIDGQLEIVMEAGQMALVPWVREVTPDGHIIMHNVALLEIIELGVDDE